MIIRNAHRREEINQYRIRSIVFEVHDDESFVGFHYLVKIRQYKAYTTYIVSDGKESLYNIPNNNSAFQFISESVDKIWKENSDWFD